MGNILRMLKPVFNKSQGYRRKIMKHLYFADSMSCAEISHTINKSIPLTTRILGELVKDGFVIETGLAPSTGGRRPVMYSLRPDHLFVVSVAMDQFITRIAIMDLKNNFVTPIGKFSLPLAQNPQALEILTRKIELYIIESGIPYEKLAGIGIGMPGFVDTTKNINYSFLNSGNRNISEFIEKALGLQVFMDNDSSLIALAELRFGAARNKSNVMVINIGWGVGLGLILKGSLFRGNNGFAGEFSHIPLFTNNKMCSCGKFGCLETETSLMVIISKAREELASGRLSIINELPEDPEEACNLLIDAAGKGDQFAVELFSEAAYNIGRGISILIHILNPELVILSGRGALAGKLWLAPVQQALNEYCIPRLAENTELAISGYNKTAELIGAAALVFENLDTEIKEGKDKKEKMMNV